MNATDLIKQHEGRRLKKYRCPAGHWSIGYGWNMDAHDLPPDIAFYLQANGRITDEMADRLLDIAIAEAEADARKLFPGFDSFSDLRKAALIDFLYNLGLPRAKGFRRMVEAANAGDWDRAADQVRDSAYWRQLGGDPIGTDDGRTERPEVIYHMLRQG